MRETVISEQDKEEERDLFSDGINLISSDKMASLTFIGLVMGLWPFAGMIIFRITPARKYIYIYFLSGVVFLFM